MLVIIAYIFEAVINLHKPTVDVLCMDRAHKNEDENEPKLIAERERTEHIDFLNC